ncbi:uncharacterized protein [Periplaneta americana]|uniref:uncharacterized protein n=1 Tax=Periplaneta americana TaxID=6978 RepID=UPI0037E8FE4F
MTTNFQEEFITVDHVIDPVTQQRSRLLNPYVFKVRQDQVLQLYKLTFMKIVNGEVQEEIINKKAHNFMGCDDSPSSKNPTCGFVYDKDVPLQYSQGFCCSCDAHVNARRQNANAVTNSHTIFHKKPLSKYNGTRYSSSFIKHKHKHKPSSQSVSQKFNTGAISIERRKKKRSLENIRYRRKFIKKQRTFMVPSHSRPYGSYATHEVQMFSKWRSNLAYDKGYDYHHPKQKGGSDNSMISVKEPSLSETKSIALDKPTLSKSKMHCDNTHSQSCLKNKNNEKPNNFYENKTENKRYRKRGNLETPKKSFKIFPIPIPITIKIKPEMRRKSQVHDTHRYYMKNLYNNENDNSNNELRNSFEGDYIGTQYQYKGRSPDPNLITKDMDTRKEMHSLHGKSNSRYRKTNFATNRKTNSLTPISSRHQSKPTPCNLVSLPMPRVEKLEDLERLARSYSMHSNNDDLSQDVLGESLKKKRQLETVNTQRRGGQNCEDKSTPPYADANTYHDSAHCLRFSELWYSVYNLEKPVVVHNVYLQLFEKQNLPDGTTNWEDLTQGSLVRIGKFCREVIDKFPRVSFVFSPYEDESNENFNLDYKTMKLMTPQPVPRDKEDMFPQVQGGPNEFLVVTDDLISTSGNECDKAGVGYEAFVKQPDRCNKKRGTCLQNQPITLWRRDIVARMERKKGKHFLENYGTIPRDPIKINLETKEEYLGLEYYDMYTSTIDIEINADLNAIIDAGSSGRITEVHVDATRPFRSLITVIVTNTGLASSSYKVRLRDFPSQAPPAWLEEKSRLIRIPPQHVQEFLLQLDGPLPAEQIHCSVELVNWKEQLVATRRIRLRQKERCLCVWHCLCACIGAGVGNDLRCEPMSAEHYNAAGFQGSLPTTTTTTTYIADNIFLSVLCFMIILFLILILLGVAKGILGLCSCPAVGMWGLDMFVEQARRIPHYYEKELCDRSVIYDCAGYPVHPDTKLRTVRTISRFAEFCINTTFFLSYPCMLCFYCGGQSLKGLRSCCILKRCVRPREVSSETLPLGDFQYVCYNEEDAADIMLTRYLAEKWQRKREAEMGCSCRADERHPLLKTYNAQCYGQCLEGYRNVGEEDSAMSNYQRDQPEAEKIEFTESESQDPEHKAAVELISELWHTRVVFRNLERPIGEVNIPPGVRYCVRGLFLTTPEGYKFIAPSPLKQYWVLVEDEIKLAEPPKDLDPDHFELDFANPAEVYRNAELSTRPKGFCINSQSSYTNEEDSSESTVPEG